MKETNTSYRNRNSNTIMLSFYLLLIKVQMQTGCHCPCILEWVVGGSVPVKQLIQILSKKTGSILYYFLDKIF